MWGTFSIAAFLDPLGQLGQLGLLFNLYVMLTKQSSCKSNTQGSFLMQQQHRWEYMMCFNSVLQHSLGPPGSAVLVSHCAHVVYVGLE